MKNIVFVADFFAEDLIGGGELNNQELIFRLIRLNYNVLKKRSFEIDVNFINNNKNSFFIIANFIGLSEQVKLSLLDKKYIIYEHDHKYLKNRNPSIYNYFLSTENNLINKQFYKNAIAIFAQSKIHCEVIWKNLGIKNIINCSGNFWSKEQLDIIKKYKNSNKIYDYGILQSNNPIKNTYEAIQYCKNKNLNFILIPFLNFEEYIKNLSECKNFVFFPSVLETLSRTSIEAKMLGCKLVTNKFLGVASEEWIKKDVDYIWNYLNTNSDEILKKIKSCIEEADYSKYFYITKPLPGISIITSIYKAEKYIENFLNNIVKQSIFDECELILINGNSPENEEKYIKPFLEKYNNIKYIKLEKDPGIYGCWNIAIQNSKFDYICNSNVDDLRVENSLEILRKHLFFSEDVDLVYGDTSIVEEMPVIEKKYNIKLSEHSIDEFSKKNMIKCLPGCMPLWKKQIHEKHGLFDESLKSAGDWEMWLRAASSGSRFKKVDFLSGFYYENPNGKSTNVKFFKEKFLEEKAIFFKYKDIFEDNFENYLPWFAREI